MEQNRDSPAVALLPNGKVLVVRGIGNTKVGRRLLNSAELYDPATNQWSTTSSMAAPRLHHTATSLPDGKVIVIGGDNGEEAQSSTELYLP
jgi:N-acetylneuraminic acid mutarotase